MEFCIVSVIMPSEVISEKSLQRELADSIIRMVPLDEIRILLACGAKVQSSLIKIQIHYKCLDRVESGFLLSGKSKRGELLSWYRRIGQG